MKIQRPNQSNLNIYNNQMKQQVQKQKMTKKQDQIQISKAAKQLQHDIKLDEDRKIRVEKIKEEIAANKYEVNLEKTAAKMIEFWSRRS